MHDVKSYVYKTFDFRRIRCPENITRHNSLLTINKNKQNEMIQSRRVPLGLTRQNYQRVAKYRNTFYSVSPAVY